MLSAEAKKKLTAPGLRLPRITGLPIGSKSRSPS